MLRSTWWLALSAIAGICATGSARAQDCDSDDACPTSSYCAFEWADGGAGVSEDVACTPEGNCGGEAAPPAPTTGTCTPLPVGACEVQADCAEGLTCVKPTYVDGCAGGAEDAPAPAPTDPGGGADVAEPAPPVDCGVSEPVEARYGNCELPAMPCTSDAECMAGLTCLPTGGTSTGSSGGTDSGGVAPGADQAPERPAEQDPVIGEPASQCGYQPASCDGGEACKAGFECVQIEVGGSCSGSTPPDCPPDELGCTPPEPEEPECTTDYAKVCLPVQDPCDTDADCAEDQKCVEFTNAEGGLESPASWGATGSVKSCLPEGIALVAQAGSGGVGGDVATGADDDLGGGKGEGPTAPEEGSNLGDDVKSGSSNCSVGFGGGSAPTLAGFVLAGLAMVRRRRRR